MTSFPPEIGQTGPSWQESWANHFAVPGPILTHLEPGWDKYQGQLWKGKGHRWQKALRVGVGVAVVGSVSGEEGLSHPPSSGRIIHIRGTSVFLAPAWELSASPSSLSCNFLFLAVQQKGL